MKVHAGIAAGGFAHHPRPSSRRRRSNQYGHGIAVRHSRHGLRATYANGSVVYQPPGTLAGQLINNTITFGDGNGNSVTAGGSHNNTITFGNGDNDSVTLGSAVRNPGGDSLTMGTGAGDTITVGFHNHADTFAFALGTGSTNFTTVTGAQSGDHFLLNSNGNGNALGHTLVVEQTQTADMASFITSLGTLTKGDTYIGYNVGGGSSAGGNGATETSL